MTIFESAMEYMTEGAARDAFIDKVKPLFDEFDTMVVNAQTAMNGEHDYKKAIKYFTEAKAMIPKLRRAIDSIPNDDKRDMRASAIGRFLTKLRKSNRFYNASKDKTTFTRNYQKEWLAWYEEDIESGIAKCKEMLSNK